MKKIMMIIMAVALVALPTKAQNFGGQSAEDKVQMQAFQSTSTMAPVNSQYSANPSLNEDGTAYSPAARTSGPKKAKTGLPDLPNTEGKQDNTPIGDAVLPLMLMALAFGGVIYLRRRKALNR